MRITYALFQKILLLTFIGITNGICIADEQDKKMASTEYASPTATYDIYKNKLQERNWNAVFRCFAPSCQDSEVLRVYDDCIIHMDQNVICMMTKNGIDLDDINGEYEIKYRDKYKANSKISRDSYKDEINKTLTQNPIQEISPQSQSLLDKSKQVAVPEQITKSVPDSTMPQFDLMLYHSIVLSKIRKKENFYVEAMNLQFPKSRELFTNGAVSDFQVKDENACIRSTVKGPIGKSYDSTTHKETKIYDSMPVEIKFVKIDNKWLIKSICITQKQQKAGPIRVPPAKS
jgi:hypothetical protein